MAVRIALIAAVAANGVIGRDNQLPWRLSADLRYFKAMTMGKPIVMGRKTFASIGKPLPGRTNIVMTRDSGLRLHGTSVWLVTHIDAVYAIAEDVAFAEEVMVIGGAEIYALTLPFADRLYLTEIHRDYAGDTFFPAFDRADWRETSREEHAADGDAPAFAFTVLDRLVPSTYRPDYGKGRIF